ncbi:MAG: hypothetical protein ACKV2T_12840 [Kofleriaceae bacterium]
MRWGIAVWVLALAACGETAAVKFVVDTSADPDIAEVRLYLGIGQGDDLALSPKGFEPQSPARQGRVYEQDVDGVVDSVRTNGATSYSFVYTAEGVEMLTAIAVGFDAQGVATSQAAAFEIPMPSEHVVVWPLALAPAVTATPTTTGPQVLVWGAEDGMQTCVHAVSPELGDHEIAYVVGSKKDRDCDGYQDGEPLECDDLFYRAHPIMRSEVNCITEVQVPIEAGLPPIRACSLGTSACVDGSALGRDTCTTEPRYCVADSTCTRCNDLECALKTWEDMTDVHQCTVEVIRTQDDTLVPCPNVIEVPSINPQLSCPNAPPRYRVSGTNNPTWSTTTDADGVRLMFSAVPTACKTLVQPSLVPGGQIDRNARFGGLLDRIASTGNHIVTPVAFELELVTTCSPSVVTCQRTSISLNAQATCVDPSIPPPSP